MKLELKWDGSDLGDVSEYYLEIWKPDPNFVGSRLELNTSEGPIQVLSWKYKDDVPLIIDELKPIFGLKKIGRHKCIVHGIKLLIARYVDRGENSTSGEDHDIHLIREHIAFRHLFGVVTRGEFLWYREGEGVMSYKDCVVSYQREKSPITTVNIKKWFDGDRREVVEVVKRLLLNSTEYRDKCLITTVQFIRIKVESKIKNINKEMVHIVNCFMSQIQIYLTYIECIDTDGEDK